MAFRVFSRGTCCACILIAGLLACPGRAPAGSIVVTNSQSGYFRLYDLDAGTSTNYGTSYPCAPAVDSLAENFYYNSLAGGSRLIEYDIETAATRFILSTGDAAHNYIRSMDVDPIRRELIILWSAPPHISTASNWIDRRNIDTGATVTIHSELMRQKVYVGEVGGYKRYEYYDYHEIEDIAVDPFSREVYWTDSYTNSVYRKALDAPTDIDVLFTSRPDPVSLALDVGAGAIFYAELGDDTRMASIRRAGINGTGAVHDIVLAFADAPRKIAVDPLEQRLYWLDGRKLRACDYDGSNMGDVLIGGSPILGDDIAVLLRPGGSPQSPRMPDAADPDDGFAFHVDDVPISPEETMLFFDPASAVGYDYAVSGANFASVLLPSVGDANYVLYLWDGDEFVYDQAVVGGQEHTFAPGGVERFRIAGIEAEAGLDPNDPLAFLTGLTFTESGPLDVTMKALVPEPGSWLLLTLAMGVCLRARRTRRTGPGSG